MKIAIIGSGIAGLASAYFLRKHSVEVFEAKPYLSLAGHGMKTSDGEVIDIPLRVIHPEYYPNLFSLCKELGVALRKLEHSGSFALSKVPEDFEFFSVPFFKKRYSLVKLNWNHLKVGIEFMRFYYLCRKQKNNSEYDGISFGEFLNKYRISDKMAQLILYPLLSSICTCSYKELDEFPARPLISMLAAIAGPAPMERFYAGTHDIEQALSKHIDKVHLSSKVEKVSIREKGGIVVINGEEKPYDHVVIATEAHLVKNFLEENEHTKSALSNLNTIPYKTTDTIIHTVDEKNEQVKNKKSLHYQEHPDGGEAQATIWLNKVEPHLNLGTQTMQTWNPFEDKVENELNRSPLNRALMTVESYQAVKDLRKLNHPSFSLAGSYLATGIPLLEGGVESAFNLSRLDH